MSKFIQIEDYDASIHSEILDALIRKDHTIVEICEERAIAEMRSYLSGRYDCDTLFNAEGTNRHPLVLMMAIDITVYHLFCIHNPQKMSQIRTDRYERAVEWLKQVSRQAIGIDGAPLLPEEDRKDNAPWLMHSNLKRTNHL